MKRYGNIFEKVVDIENIKLAHRYAKKTNHFIRGV